MSAAVIYKYPLQSSSVFEDWPIGSIVLTVATQHGLPTLWVQHPADADGVQPPRTFIAVPTGELFSTDEATYVGTCHDVGGSFVFHIFEVPA